MKSCLTIVSRYFKVFSSLFYLKNMPDSFDIFPAETEAITTPHTDEDYLRVCIEQFGGDLELMLDAAREAFRNVFQAETDSLFSDNPEAHLSNIERIIRGEINFLSSL